MTPKEIDALSEETKEELRSIAATEAPQEHVKDFKWDAAPGAEVDIHPNRARKFRVIADLYEKLPDWCNSIPTAREWISGIPHWSENSQVRGQKWDPIRARHSRKFYYLSELEKIGKRLLMTCHSRSASLTQTQPLAGFNLSAK